jgi:hypothetical protein
LQLLHYKLAVEEKINLARAKFGGEVDCRDDRTPLCNIVCGCANCGSD